jgi:hypothetical protein
MTTHSRNGKIARLPSALREELNRRLYAGATGRSLIAWLNELPEVRTAMNDYFEGSEIREQNISEWKKGGYEDWLRQEEAMALAERLYERAEQTKARGKERMPMSEVLHLWMTSRYVVSTQEIESMEGEAAWRKQRQMCEDLMKMRRAEHRAEHLQLERERVELQREEVQIERERLEMQRAEKKRGNKARRKNQPEGEPDPDGPWQDWSDEERIVWARKPENLDRISPPMTDEEHAARWKEFLGISDTPKSSRE